MGGDGIIDTCRRLCLSDPSKGFLHMFAVYEQICFDTRFGKEMLRNLGLRGCPMLSASEYSTLEDQVSRYKRLGWHCLPLKDSSSSTGVSCWTLAEHQRRTQTEEETVRIAKLELLDELEELNLLQEHYLMLIACSSAGEADGEDGDGGGLLWDIDDLY